MTNDTRADHALVEAWNAGDNAAGNALLARHFRSLLRFFENKVGAESDELIQRTLLACAEGHRQFRGESSFRTYLFAIARHELHRYFRERGARALRVDCGVSSLLDPRTSVSARIGQREQTETLESALQQLPLDDQILLDLFYVEELDSQQLGQVFGLEASSIRSRLHRTRAELGRLLDQAGQDTSNRPEL